MWTLKPLSRLTKELVGIEKGEANELQENYPQELEQVTTQLNTLLHTEQNQRKRYRNALSDLAHSLKTPLAVMQSHPDLSVSSVEQLTSISQIIEHQLKRAQSAGESSWHLGVSVKPVALKLISTLEKIYRDKALLIDAELAEQAIFKGDEADLMEILGNILDNAYKAAKGRVALRVSIEQQQLVIAISDDGVGINQSQQQAIFNRGNRADTYQKGHGIGLAIVKDLVDSYQGSLEISTSSTLQGALFILRFNIE